MPDPALAAYALACLLALAPPARRSAPPGWEETEETYRGRLSGIAGDIGAVSTSRMHVAALVGVGAHESAFAPDTDAGGECYRVGSWASRCDGGRAVSLWQLQDADPERRALFRSDRRAAAREALRRILGSLGACRQNEPALRLARFASGTCSRGWEAARGLDVFVRRALSVRE